MRTVLQCLLPVALAASLFAAPHPSLPPTGSLEGLGVNIHFTDPQPGELEMIKAAGFRWVRMDLTWAGTEKQRGEYDFSAYDRLSSALEKNGLRALFILDYGHPLYAEPGDKHPFTSRAGTEEFREAYARWAAAAVSCFAGKGYLFELWNEPNHEGFWKPKADVKQYAAMAKAACLAIEKAAPKEAIVGPATSTIDLPFLEECFKAGLLEHWAAVSVHPYRQQSPETVEDEYRDLRLLIRRYAAKDKTIPILSGEWGYSTQYPAFAGKGDIEREDLQAKYLVRMFLTNIANDIPLSIWYDWRDDGDNPAEVEHRFGIVRRAYHEGAAEPFEPKPAYLALQRLTTELKGMKFDKCLLEPKEHYTLFFKGGGQLKLVNWRWDKADRSTIFIGGSTFDSLAVASGKRETLSAQHEGSPWLDFLADDDVRVLVPPKPSDWLRFVAAWERAPLDTPLPGAAYVNATTRFHNPTKRTFGIQFLARDHTRDSANAVDIRIFPVIKVPPEKTRTALSASHIYHWKTDQWLEYEVAFWMDESLATLSQKSNVLMEAPRSIVVLPPSRDAAFALVENPTGKAWEFKARWDGETNDPNVKPSQIRVHEFPVTIPEGVRQHIIKFSDFVPAGSSPMDYERHDVSLHAGVGYESVSQMLRRLTGDFSAGKIKAAPDGDAAAEAHVTVENATHFTRSLADDVPLKVKYRFGAGWKFFDLLWSETPRQYHYDRKISAYGVWLYGDGKGCQARIRFTDATGQTFQSDGPKIDFTGWRFVKFPMLSYPETPLAHWGGANDGMVHHPIKWDSVLLLDNISRQPVEGEVYLSGPTLLH